MRAFAAGLTVTVGLALATGQAVGAKRVKPSPKKGVGAWHFAGIGAAMTDVNVSWVYNWGPAPNGVLVPPGVEFVPMIWDETHVTPAELAAAKKAGKVLLGFNEPDHDEQANMTPEQALALWPQLMATGLRLGSPAMAHDPRTNGWLDAFMAAVVQRGLRVDFICLHRYVGEFEPAAATKALEEFLVGVHRKYGLPIWLTEYALVRWTKPTAYASRGQQAAFAAQSIGLLERLPFVERYAWFALPPSAKAPGLTDTETVSLYTPLGAPTIVGAAYRAAGLVARPVKAPASAGRSRGTLDAPGQTLP